MLTLVPLHKDGYSYCAVFPGQRSDLWPSGFGSEVAVPLEVDPAWWTAPDKSWLDNDEQDWPSDVARNCSRLGYEVSFSSGVPLIGRELLQRNDAYFWEHLTLGLVSRDNSIGDLPGWAWLRQELLTSLIPEAWIAPPACTAVIHTSGEDRMFILTPAKSLLEGWVAGHLGSYFASDAASSEVARSEDLQEITRWLLEASLVRGVQISKLTLEKQSSNAKVCLSGRWGRGTDSGLQLGEPLGARFGKEWTFPMR